MTATDWDEMLTAADREVLARGRWARRAGMGERPALLIVDAQLYMSGVRGAPGNAEKYPLSCGEVAFAAVDCIAQLLAAARATGVPVFFTRFVADPINDDVGMFHRKIGIGIGRGEGLFFRGTRGAEIVPELAPLPGEIVIDKKKSSAFFGTPLLSLLIDRHVDTCIITGGATSNCIRATVLDSAQYNFFTIVPEEAVFDRLPLAHKVNLFDMNRMHGDVVPVAEALQYLARTSAARTAGAGRTAGGTGEKE